MPQERLIMPEINYFAIFVSGVAFMIIGSIWYGPLFGKLWMQGMGWNPDDPEFIAKMKKSAGPAYIQMFIGALLSSYVLAHILVAISKADPQMTGAAAGLWTAFFLWLGFVLPVKYGEKIWNGKAFKYVAIDLSYQLVALLVAGVIIASWA